MSRETKKVRQNFPWHHDFRKVEQLPDIKLIRTAFFAYTILISINMAAILYGVWQEYNIGLAEAELAKLELDVAKDKPVFDKIGKQKKEFGALQLKVDEVSLFERDKIRPDVLIQMVAALKHASMEFSALRITTTQMIIRGNAEGSRDETSGFVSDFVGKLRADVGVKKYYQSVQEGGLTPDIATGKMNFEITLSRSADRTKK